MDLQGRDLNEGLRGDDVALLHTELGILELEIPRREIARSWFGEGTRRVVEAFQRSVGLRPTGVVDERTARHINAAVDAREAPPRRTPGYRVEGQVTCDVRAGVAGLRVDVVDKGIGGDRPLATTRTDDRGRYRVRFDGDALAERDKSRPDLQARVSRRQRLLGASAVHYDATALTTLDVVIDDAAATELPSEYETLTASVAGHHRGRLGDLAEDDERQDITYLAHKTGWDARAVAMAVLADQFAARSAGSNRQQGIEPALFYALFRAGQPADEQALYRLSPETASGIWRRAIEHGVLPRSMAERVAEAAERFQRLAARQALSARPAAGVSNLGEMLSVSLGDDRERQQLFADLCTRHREAPQRLWKAVRENLGEAVERRLRTDGQLGYLTLDNAPLVRKLNRAAGSGGLSDTRNLVASGHYRASRWLDELDDVPLPPEIPGRDDGVRRARYAELMAAQVRISFPTAVVAEMVRAGETPVAAGSEQPVHAFLAEHHDRFEIGAEPVGRYVARNELDVAPAVLREIKRIQRVRQITTDDDAMNALLSSGVDSALAVCQFERESFVKAHGRAVGGTARARAIHAKAQQVHNAVLNVATSYLVAGSIPAVGAHGEGKLLDVSPKKLASLTDLAKDVIAYPTLEELLGELDFCACEHCRSILSPAAYLVDLLLFCDRPDNERENPLKVLLDRRPDLEHLPLTCDNTLTPLPYIDLTNEILEYYVTNDLSLDAYTGHDTDGSVPPEELLASPQFVEATAYEALADAAFPPPLPLHRPLETLRRCFDRFEAPLSDVMETLRSDDALERASDDGYGWRDILMEELRLSRAEHALLTDRTIGVGELYGFAGSLSEAQVVERLGGAKAYARRAGISYEELYEILETRFINPAAALIPAAERLGVPLATLKALKDGALDDAAFEALLPPRLDRSAYGGDVVAWVKDDANYDRLMGLIVVAREGSGEDNCSMDDVEFRYADPGAEAGLRAVDFVRLLRFIRLWRTLGWTIQQTDDAITALFPAELVSREPDEAVELEQLDRGFLALLPRLGVVLRAMTALKLKAKRDLAPLLACFAPIGTHGPGSLYRQMFTRSTIDEQDPAFAEDGFGAYLTDTDETLARHASTLRAAFRLTDSELGEICAALGYDADTPLTLANISAIHRRGWLARELRLSVRELLALMRVTSIDPFEVPEPPDAGLLRMCRLVAQLREASLKPVEALYLWWNQDLSGRSAPGDEELLGFARDLRNGLMAVEREFALADDPDGELARARMAMVYGTAATDTFFGLLGNTLVTEVGYGHDQPALDAAFVALAPDRIAYDPLRKRLSFAGRMDEATRDALVAAAGAELGAAVGELYEANRDAVGPFFERYPELQPLLDAYTASTAPLEERRSALLAAFLPELSRRRARQQAVRAIAAVAKADEGLAAAVLDDAAVLRAATAADRPAVDDLIALATPGLSADVFDGASAAGVLVRTHEIHADLDYDPDRNHPLPAHSTDPAGAISAIWRGHLQAPEAGFYNLRVEADAGATVQLTLDGRDVALVESGGVWSNAAAVELRSGALHAVTLRVEDVRQRLRVQWQGHGTGWQTLPPRHLYPAVTVAHLRAVYVRFLKIASLAKELGLAPAEIAHFAAEQDLHVAGASVWNALPADADPDEATSRTLLQACTTLLDFARIKDELSPDDGRLLAVLQDPLAATAEPGALLPALARWDLDSLDALLTHFGETRADLGRFAVFRRVEAAFARLTRLRISAAALLEAATNAPTDATVRTLQEALRARYETADWLDVLQPINDELRELRRDALVTHILHRMSADPATAHIDTPDKLFEYFLMDVQMAACTRTSRIRHALSTVQLFIERCLMNLEPRVAPSSIRAPMWEWMRRYRVWEANRKVFLYPENWLEPELRDDATPLFTEAMSGLLQGDITEDRAATALLEYLAKLDEIAQLEPCAIHHVEQDPGTADDVSHVFARTPGGKSKYFYRRREYGYWTPWEVIKADIEGNPLLPVMWKGRLLLFWLKILKGAPLQKPKVPTGDLADVEASDTVSDSALDVEIKALLCWSEYARGEWQPARTSEVDRPAFVTRISPDAFSRDSLRLMAVNHGDALRVFITDGSPGATYFQLDNTHSAPVWGIKVNHVLPEPRVLDTFGQTLTATYEDATQIDGVLKRPILKTAASDRAVQPHHALQASRVAPFLYSDSRHVFWVTTELGLRKLPRWPLYGIGGSTGVLVTDAPPIVLAKAHALVDTIGPVRAGRNAGAVDRAPIERFITEDALIDKGLGTPGTVEIGDRLIGPGGSIAKSALER